MAKANRVSEGQDAVVVERQRCHDLAAMVGANPERYAQRIGAPDVAAAICYLIEGGYTTADAPAFGDRPA